MFDGVSFRCEIELVVTGGERMKAVSQWGGVYKTSADFTILFKVRRRQAYLGGGRWEVGGAWKTFVNQIIIPPRITGAYSGFSPGGVRFYKYIKTIFRTKQIPPLPQIKGKKNCKWLFGLSVGWLVRWSVCHNFLAWKVSLTDPFISYIPITLSFL